MSTEERTGLRSLQMPLYALLLLYSACGFLFLMGLYALITYKLDSGNRLSARLGFAITFSLIPAGLSLLAHAYLRIFRGHNVALTYILMFLLTHLFWYYVHG